MAPFVAAVHSYEPFVRLEDYDWYAFHMYRLFVPYH